MAEEKKNRQGTDRGMDCGRENNGEASDRTMLLSNSAEFDGLKDEHRNLL